MKIKFIWFLEQFGDISLIFCRYICVVFAEVSY